ncbi:hypothetical protein PN836_020510 [Ningiella sp. W23]|uniref:hypothetical protein n=1 Tax=Ningiella sp. W23 TaxID=3023715 RepID=UPI0037562FF1
MKVNILIVCIGISALAMQAAAAWNEESVGRASQVSELIEYFGNVDRNQDGVISLREASMQVQLLKDFTRVDINQDGYVSLEELETSSFSIGSFSQLAIEKTS